MLQEALEEGGFVPNQYLDKKHLDEVFNKISYRNAEALYAAIDLVSFQQQQLPIV